MTNKYDLLISKLVLKLRRWKKDRGRRLFLDHKGTLSQKFSDSSSDIRSDFLLVEGLVVNLLLTKDFVREIIPKELLIKIF